MIEIFCYHFEEIKRKINKLIHCCCGLVIDEFHDLIQLKLRNREELESGNRNLD